MRHPRIRGIPSCVTELLTAGPTYSWARAYATSGQVCCFTGIVLQRTQKC